ncbi:CbrC family protein [Streptomyces sp. TN58]|uniref:CbrC family protein n=1 Tax=Streptomyces sp. TN58 TaxID=234612 RepID=UPI000950A23A|nr:hypothetical protein BSL84_21620 [Streptomyces sp. TN58]
MTLGLGCCGRDRLRIEGRVQSGRTCLCCGRARGFIHTGPVYAVEKLSGLLCPYCSAAAKYDAHFIGDPVGDDVPLPPPSEARCTRVDGRPNWSR